MDAAGADTESSGAVDEPDDTLEDPDVLYDWTGPSTDVEEKAQMQALKAKIEDTVSKLSYSSRF